MAALISVAILIRGCSPPRLAYADQNQVLSGKKSQVINCQETLRKDPVVFPKTNERGYSSEIVLKCESGNYVVVGTVLPKGPDGRVTLVRRGPDRTGQFELLEPMICGTQLGVQPDAER